MKVKCLALVLAIVVGVGSAAGQELLYNPGFEDLNTDTAYGDGWGKYGNADFNNFFGNPHASFFMDNPSNFGGVFQQGIAGGGGMTYQFDLLNVRIEANADANLRFGLEYYELDDSTQAGPADIVSIPLSPTGDGLSFSMMGTAPAGTVWVRPIIQFDDVQSTASEQENAFVFEASLTKVPEPAAALLFVLGLTGLLVMRKR